MSEYEGKPQGPTNAEDYGERHSILLSREDILSLENLLQWIVDEQGSGVEGIVGLPIVVTLATHLPHALALLDMPMEHATELLDHIMEVATAPLAQP